MKNLKRSSAWVVATLIIGVASVMAPGVQAGERLLLNLEDRDFELKGGIKDINLLSLLRDQHPDTNFKEVELVKIELMAKAKSDNAQFWFNLGGTETRRQQIKRGNYKDRSAQSYHRHSVAFTDRGITPAPWTMRVRGDTRMVRVYLEVNDCRRSECSFQQKTTTRKFRLSGGALIDTAPDGLRKIGLRRELAKRYNDADFSRAQIVSVELKLKAKERDTSVVFLTAGEATSRIARIAGGPKRFRNKKASSWETQKLELKSPDPGGTRWVLNFRRGVVNVQEVAVTTRDQAFWTPRAAAPSTTDTGANTGTSNNNAGTARCTAKSCPKGPAVISRAEGPRSCYASGDGRRIDRRDGARVAWRSGCEGGRCVQTREVCYESRTCNCANGSGRCKEPSSCATGAGCVHGYTTVKMHCKSGLFNLN